MLPRLFLCHGSNALQFGRALLFYFVHFGVAAVNARLPFVQVLLPLLQFGQQIVQIDLPLIEPFLCARQILVTPLHSFVRLLAHLLYFALRFVQNLLRFSLRRLFQVFRICFRLAFVSLCLRLRVGHQLVINGLELGLIIIICPTETSRYAQNQRNDDPDYS